MTKQTEALKLALEALEEIHVGNMTPMAEANWNKAITAIKEALAQPEQEPVAIIPSNTRYTVEVEGRGQTYWDNIHDAITNAQRAVYSGVDNTTRALDDLKAGRIAEWSYGFSAVRIYPPQNTTPPQQEPVARSAAYDMIDRFMQNNLNSDADYAEYSKALDSLYTTPQQRKPLTDEHPLMVFAKECVLGAYQETELADAAQRAIEAAHGIKE